MAPYYYATHIGLTGKEKRDYALAMRRIDYGIWGYKPSTFRVLTLTTREGDDNTKETFRKHFKKLVLTWRKDGLVIEFYGSFELSPQKGLLHWHGILRVKGGYFPVTRRELGDLWNDIHGAFVVDIDEVKSMRVLQVYITKHMVKDYLKEGVAGNKIMMSRGWMRPGIKELVWYFRQWWINVYGLVWMDAKGFEVMNKVVRCYCEKKDVYVKAKGGWFSLSKDGNYYGEILGFE